MNLHGFFAELKRRNVYKVAVAYAVVGWLIIQIATSTFPVLEIPNWAAKLVIAVVLLGFPIALVIAWAFEMTPEGLKRTEDISPNERLPYWSRRKFAVVIVVLALIAGGLLLFQLWHNHFIRSADQTETRPSKIPEKSIAVLPFVNMSSDKENEYFVDGLTEEILNRLAQVSGLRVPGRTSSFAFKGKNTDLRQIGATLNVAHVLEGSVRKSGDRLRITAQLVRTGDGFHLWSQSFDRKLNDVFAIQDEIARAIASALSVQLKVAQSTSSESPTQDMEAYDDYLQARSLMVQRTTESLRLANDLLERAVRRDPKFARAWAALAEVRAAARFFGLGGMKETLASAETAARTALGLDDSIAAAHSALADVLRDRFAFMEAEAENRRAIALGPGEADTHSHYAAFLITVGRFDIASFEAKRAAELEPLEWINPLFSALIHLCRGELAQSAALIDRSKQISQKSLDFQMRVELLYALSSGDRERALGVLREATRPISRPVANSLLDAITNGLASEKDDPELRPALEQAARLGQETNQIGLPFAAVAVFRGQKAVALDALWLDFNSPGGLDSALLWTPVFRPLWREPRFLELIRAMKLPEYWRAAGWSEFCRPKGDNDFECLAP
jgi:adenylate cyclase